MSDSGVSPDPADPVHDPNPADPVDDPNVKKNPSMPSQPDHDALSAKGWDHAGKILLREIGAKSIPSLISRVRSLSTDTNQTLLGVGVGGITGVLTAGISLALGAPLLAVAALGGGIGIPSAAIAMFLYRRTNPEIIKNKRLNMRSRELAWKGGTERVEGLREVKAKAILTA